MDATAVAAARGIAVPSLRASHYFIVAAYFGGFQALMPALGWVLGTTAGDAVAAWDHWIAFALLGGIGAKMLYEAIRGGDDEPEARADTDPFSFRIMLPLAVATSIDALAAGVTLPMMSAPPLVSIATIGVVTGGLAAAGLAAGKRFGSLLGRRLDAFGGVLLILLGIKTLVEHLSG